MPSVVLYESDMLLTEYRGRRAAVVENQHLRLTVLQEGGHIAEIAAGKSGVNPLWTPPWPSVEPSQWDPQRHPEYGNDAESRLLAGIMGHNLCLDIFGGPSEDEYAAGLTVHGEASVAPYEFSAVPAGLRASACFPVSQLAFTRELRLAGHTVEITETVKNLAAADRPVGWTQHVTLGPPFLERGATEFRVTATRSKVFESDFGGPAAYLPVGAEFDWPMAPRAGGGTVDLRVFTDLPVSAAFTTHLMDPAREHASFVAWSPRHQLAFGYVWRRADFPWLGIWEENHCRTHKPWNGAGLTRGMEFGVSPFPETRRKMIERGSLFGVPSFRWIPARGQVTVEYRAALMPSASAPGELTWSSGGVRFA